MMKLPISLRLTSVQRSLSPKSAQMGPRVSALLQEILARDGNSAQQSLSQIVVDAEAAVSGEAAQRLPAGEGKGVEMNINSGIN